MPELPEAETIARDLDARVRGARVRRVEVQRPDILVPGLTPRRLDRALKDRGLVQVGRRGKNVVLLFDDETRLVVNLGMTGRLVASDAPRAAELHHVAARIEFADGRAVLYDDARRFGRLDLRTADRWTDRDLELGMEPLSDGFTGAHLFRATRRSRVPLRNWLLDQRRVAGIGNIYANEALFIAGVRPTRRAFRLTRREADRLADAVRAVLLAAIDARGTTIDDYRDASGEAGGFQFRLRVYGRDGLACPACGTPVKRIVLTNRSAFYCPRCQR